MQLLKRAAIILLIFTIIVLVIVIAIKLKAPKASEPYNIHTWKLFDDNEVTYYEVKYGASGFTANLYQYILFKNNENKLGEKYRIGIGGSYKALELYVNEGVDLIWLRGKEAGSKNSYLIAALDVKNKIFLSRDKLHFDEKDLTSSELNFIKRIKSETGKIVDEVRPTAVQYEIPK